MITPLNARDPIARVQNWVADSKAAHPVNYQTAVDVFEADFDAITGKDRIQDQRHPLFPDRLDFYMDADERPGEVEIPDMGSFHATPEGFMLRITPSERKAIDIDGSEKILPAPRDSRSYLIDVATGAIKVTHEGANGGEDPNPYEGMVESYIIDTQQHVIRDYERHTKFWHSR